MALSLKPLVSQMISNISCGIFTGCVLGHVPRDSKVPVSGYETWLEWSGLSMFLPSQHLPPSLASLSLMAEVAWCILT